MIDVVSQLHRDDGEFGSLTSELRVRVLNGSSTGCLVESTRPLVIGTVAGLRVNLLGREYDDDVQVTRCQAIGTGTVFHVAMQFLSTTPPYAGSLRYAIYREFGHIAGWLHAPEGTSEQPDRMSRRRTADAADE